MNKQEFLAMSLPYGLKVTVQGKSNVSGEHIYMLYSAYSDTTVIEVVGESDFKTDKYKPILRPLPDLTKPIEHKGEVFVPIKNIKELFVDGTEDVLSQSIEAIEYFIENNFFSRIEYLPFVLIQKLIEWHFDIANLIKESEAIDINTLSVNPYK